MRVDLTYMNPSIFRNALARIAYDTIAEFTKRYLENPLESMHIRINGRKIINERLGIYVDNSDKLGL